MQRTAHFTADELRRMETYHARPPASSYSSASSSSSSSSAPSVDAASSSNGAEAGIGTPPAKRKRRPRVVFSPYDYETRRAHSTAHTPTTKRRSKVGGAAHTHARPVSALTGAPSCFQHLHQQSQRPQSGVVRSPTAHLRPCLHQGGSSAAHS